MKLGEKPHREMEPTTTEARSVAVLIAPYAPTIIHFRGALIQALQKHGYQVLVLAPDYTPETEQAVRNLGAVPISFPLQRTGMNPLQDLRTLFYLYYFFKNYRPKMIFSYNIKPVIYGILAGALAKVPNRCALITGLGHTFMPNKSLKHSLVTKLTTALYRTALRHAQSVMFQNKDDLQEMLDLGLVSSEKAVLVGATGVSLDDFRPAPPVLEPITFTLAARLLREKGIPEFAQAARHIKAKYPNTRFWLLGGLDTNPSALTQSEVEAWVKEGILEWFGQVPDVRPYFAQTSVYVLPSYYREGVPRSTQEAMAMARPVITTDAPGCRETVVDGVNGYLVPVRDVEALVQAMERFIQEPRLIITMGQASRKLAEERFDVHQINRRILEVIGGLSEEK